MESVNLKTGLPCCPGRPQGDHGGLQGLPRSLWARSQPKTPGRNRDLPPGGVRPGGAGSAHPMCNTGPGCWAAATAVGPRAPSRRDQHHRRLRLGCWGIYSAASELMSTWVKRRHNRGDARRPLCGISGHHVAFTAMLPLNRKPPAPRKARCGSKGHEVLTREPAPVLIGSRWLLRAGSGAG